MSDKYTPIIGMEVHVELSTESKMFCRCSAVHFQVPPNTHVCPVCLGLPGALPVPNGKAIEDTIKIGLALNCQINTQSKFDRKHYFYPDLPKGYQISQYDQPLCYNGLVTLSNGKRIRITRVHLEEDTGKLKHEKVEGKDVTLIDYNRSGVPLVEIVTEPDLSTAEETKEYLKLIHSTVRFLGVSDADMEKGSMRLEANISLSTDGGLPAYKVEVKNVNSFRYIGAAIDYEIERHKNLLEKGEMPRQETRGWNLGGRKTVSQRSKEEAKDYRYFPEPDIPPLVIEREKVERFKNELPILPSQVIATLVEKGIRLDYAQTVAENQELTKYVLELVELAKENIDRLVGVVINAKEDWHKLSPAELIERVSSKEKEKITDEDQIEMWVKEAISQNSGVVEDYKRGKTNALQFLLGQVMGRSKGRAEAKVVARILLERLT